MSSASRGAPGGSLYGVVELDVSFPSFNVKLDAFKTINFQANLKNTITSLEAATAELKKLATLDLDYKMPGLAAFRADTEQMIRMLHRVCYKVEDALHERQNE